MIPCKLLAALIFAAGCILSSPVVDAAKKSKPAVSLATTAEQLGDLYGVQQMQRLATLGDRDSLIAAALIGLRSSGGAAPAGHTEILQQLQREHAGDPLTLYAVALVCQGQTNCSQTDAQVRLLALEPGNVVHHLVLPNAGPPSREQLHAAAAVGAADTHFSPLLGLVRKALDGQSAPAGSRGTLDEAELALLLRRNELASVPWPLLAPLMGLCNADLASRADQVALHEDCASVGDKLLHERGNNIVTRMFGGTLLRRFAKGTAAAEEALAFRRQYVWLSEQPDTDGSAARERLNAEEIEFGEWEAFQRHAERAGVARMPPAGWTPKNAESVLLPEERTVQASRN